MKSFAGQLEFKGGGVNRQNEQVGIKLKIGMTYQDKELMLLGAEYIYKTVMGNKVRYVVRGSI